MIAGCPKCDARYRIDAGQIGADGSKLRCTKCSAVFMVRVPRAKESPGAAAAPRAKASSEVAPAPIAEASRAVSEQSDVSPRPASTPESGPDRDLSRLLLVADPNEERGKQTVAAIESWGLQAILVHDGVEALLSIHRIPPKLVVLDAMLPKMYGIQVCEILKRNESLCHIKVVLVGVIDQQNRFRRQPGDLYGADVYLEEPDLPDGLLPLLRGAGLPVSDDPISERAPIPRPVGEAPTAPPAPDPVASAPPPPPAPVAEDPEITAERERAERLARIAVSEMLLYQPEKFDAAIRDQNLEQVLDPEIQEARALIRQRISEAVRAEKDFILAELERVALQRSSQG